MFSFSGWQKNIAFFLGGQSLSLLGSSLVQYALIWHITMTTASGSALMLSTLCGFAPQILMAVFAGAWIDRFNRKHVCMLADACIALATLVLALFFMQGYRALWLIYVVLALRAAGTGLQMPLVNALIPQLTPKESLMRVNSIYSTLSAVIMLISPAISGLIYALISIDTIFFIDVFTACVGIGLFWRIPVPAPDHEEQKMAGLESLKQGIAYVRASLGLKRLLLFLFVTLFLISPAAFLTPLLVSRSFGPELWRLSVSEMCFSAGAVAGGLLMASWGGWKNRWHTMCAACALYGFLMVCMGLIPVYIAYLVCNFTIGILMPAFNAPVNSLIQESVEGRMHGRVFSLVHVGNSCALPLGMALWGPLADRVSVQSILLLCGSLVLLCGLCFYAVQNWGKTVQPRV